MTSKRLKVGAAVGMAALLVLLLAVFAIPRHTTLHIEQNLAALPVVPRVFALTARSADIEIDLVDAPAGALSLTGEQRGFGLPGSRVRADARFEAQPLPTLFYRLEPAGWLTRLSGSVRVRLPAAQLTSLIVRLGRGNIRVVDATAQGVARHGQLRLTLQTGAGAIQRPVLAAPAIRPAATQPVRP